MDRKLHALVKLDVTSDVVRIDVRGSLDHHSRPALVLVIRRIRRMGITSHIRWISPRLLSSSRLPLWDSATTSTRSTAAPAKAAPPAGAGVSLDFMPRRDDVAADAGTGFRTIEITGGVRGSIDPSGCGPLAQYSPTTNFLRPATRCSECWTTLPGSPGPNSWPGTMRSAWKSPGGRVPEPPEGCRRRRRSRPPRPGKELALLRVSYPASAVATVEVCHMPRSHPARARPRNSRRPPPSACRRTQTVFPAEFPDRQPVRRPCWPPTCSSRGTSRRSAHQQDPDGGRRLRGELLPARQLDPVSRLQDQLGGSAVDPRSLRGALRQRGQLAAVGYSNQGLDIDQIVIAVIEHVRATTDQPVLLRPQLRRHGGDAGGRPPARTARRRGGVHPAGLQPLQQVRCPGPELVRRRGGALRGRIPDPAVLRGGYELGERIVHKDERTWRRLWTRALEQLSPIAPSSVLIQSESAYIYHFDATGSPASSGGTGWLSSATRVTAP